MTQNSNNRNDLMQSTLNILKGKRKDLILRLCLLFASLALIAVLLFSVTVAWSTNVVRTGGLSFEAERWGFDGDIDVINRSINISPGDEGVVPLKITNKGTHTVSASVTASKSLMTSSMQSRIYFYVDTEAERNGETLDRVYISSNSSYTYVIPPSSELILYENQHNGALVKYEWVYDVLGYYVLGTKTESGESSFVEIEEYIRPIVYDFDETKTTFNDQILETIDGVKTAEEFMLEISQSDGYEGEVDLENPTTSGYYPIYVNSEGYGVWMHLCTLSEIKANTEVDSQIGNDPTSISCTARLNVVGYNSKEEYAVVGSESEFISAVNQAGDEIIKLSDDITLSSKITLNSGNQVMIDLGDNTLSSDLATMFDVKEGASLTISNGTVEGSGSNYLAYAAGSTVNLNNLTVTNVKRGLYIRDDQPSSGTDVYGDSSIFITNCEIEASEIGVFLYGNGDRSEGNTLVKISNSKISGDSYAGIATNGSYEGSHIVIDQCEIKGLTGIYQPNGESLLELTSSTLIGTGGAGITVKGGTVNVTDCVLSSISTNTSEPSFVNGGFSDLSVGIYVEAGYAYPIVVNVYGDTVVSGGCYYALVNYEAEAKQGSDINVYSGSFKNFALTDAPDDFDINAYISDLESCGINIAEGVTVIADGDKDFKTSTD